MCGRWGGDRNVRRLPVPHDRNRERRGWQSPEGSRRSATSTDRSHLVRPTSLGGDGRLDRGHALDVVRIVLEPITGVDGTAVAKEARAHARRPASKVLNMSSIAMSFFGSVFEGSLRSSLRTSATGLNMSFENGFFPPMMYLRPSMG